MVEGYVDGEMIEIGDPTEEPSAAESQPQVVIQYHERGGVPWMLIPPLLVLSAVGSVLLYHKLVPRPIPTQPPVILAKADRSDEPADDGPRSLERTLLAPEIPPLEKSTETAPPIIATPQPPVDPVVPPTVPDGPLTEPVPAVDPVPAPKAQGFGFDLKALEAERKADPVIDPALAPVLQEARPEDRDQPREINPAILPPDPRLARARQQQRRVEAIRKFEEERLRYHADLKEICRKLGENSGPEILKLSKKYDIRLEPTAKQEAAQRLGVTGSHMGADRKTRIDLLRSLGYPEPVILDDIFLTHLKKQVGERDGPRNHAEAYYRSALILLRNPPMSSAPRANPAELPR